MEKVGTPQCIIFDLSEVLIAGLVGVEKELSRLLLLPEDRILNAFGGDRFEELLVGRISEDAYLEHLIAREGWRIRLAPLKAAIRRNFHREVAGAVSLLRDVASCHPVALLSDHAAEWSAYIQGIHPFLQMFDHAFFSYELRRTKADPQTFVQVLDVLSLPPASCLFVDDNPTNVGVAESVGVPGIRFRSAGQLVAELRLRGVGGL
jgi:FMN phosphatase YigB (HAD superfamily)